jgi:integrase
MNMQKKTMSAREFAHSLVSQVLVLGTQKSALGGLARHVIRSLGTARNVEQCEVDFLNWRIAGGKAMKAPVTRWEITEYLMFESTRWRQKTLDQHRQALALIHSVVIEKMDAGVPTIAVGRAYTRAEMEQITAHQEQHNALATRIAFAAGLRASEFLELRRGDELPPQENRPWREDLFNGMPDGVIYGTTGKGGLARALLIPTELHHELERVRRDTRLIVTDRGVDRESVYDIGGGQALSQSFSDASKRALGFSLGFHGLRHAFGQRCLDALIACGIAPLDALEIVSHLMGHLRKEISMAYMPRRS